MRASTCDHCTKLSVLHVLQDTVVEEKLAKYIDEQKQEKELGKDKSLPQRYGDEFEEKLTNELRARLEPAQFARPEKDGDFAQTLELMRAKVPVIYQGGLEHRGERTVFRGKPDFLVLDGWELFFDDQGLAAGRSAETTNSGYTVWDAKYSSHPKPEYALQVAIYIEALSQVGLLAANADHGLILGNRTLFPLKEAEVVPATRLARAQLEKAITKVESNNRSQLLENFTWHCAGNKQCEICEYPKLCKDDREATSDLLLVAGLGKSMRDKLLIAGITDMVMLANSELASVKDVSVQTFEKLKLQAKLQLKSRSSEKPESELLANPILQYLPKPDDADVFFDMEGFPYFREGGLEYLFGNWVREQEFVEFWAVDRRTEKIAFINFMTWLYKRMMENPKAHVYHYASYERTALNRLANRFAVMERELAQLEDEHRFVDLYPMVTKSIRVGEPKYSIKNLERHYGFDKRAGVQGGDESIEEFVNWRDLEEQLASGVELEDRAKTIADSKAIFNRIRDYNIEDVKSTMELYDWLRKFEGASTKPWESIFYKSEEEASGQLTAKQMKLMELERITSYLFDPVADYEKGHDAKMDAQVAAWEALAHSVLFYQREDVMFWADLNIRMTLDDEDIVQDREAMLVNDAVEAGLDGLEITAGHTGQYQLQVDAEELFQPKAGTPLAVRYEMEPGIVRWEFGKVISLEAGELVFSWSPKDPENLKHRPTAIFDVTKFNTVGKENFLIETAKEITSVWGSPFSEPPRGYPILDLLLRREPVMVDSKPLVQPDPEDYLPALIDAANRMHRSAIAVQGPPGTGKTYLASRLIKHLVESGKRVAVGTNSHAAVENLLDECITADMQPLQVLKVLNTGTPDDYKWTAYKSASTLATALKRSSGGLVMGGTSFGLCNKEVREHHFDYLIIDEAAQYSLVDLIAASGIADNVILFGDPQQLAQVVQAVHPGGVENSALGHFIGDNAILPTGLGYFVEVTRRMHPNLTEAVSWLSYEGRLRSIEKTKLNVISGVEPGLHPIQLDHTGNSTHSPEEVEEVIRLVGKHIADVGPEEIIIVAPYNNQVNAIRKALDQAGFEEVRVGTVDKFQGQEGMVVIVSLACSSADDAPRGLDFLLDRNRLNVAISRGKSVCYLVHSKDLLSASFRSIEDVKSVSRLAGLSLHAHLPRTERFASQDS
jgi:uncharacterized protein